MKNARGVIIGVAADRPHRDLLRRAVPVHPRHRLQGGQRGGAAGVLLADELRAPRQPGRRRSRPGTT